MWLAIAIVLTLSGELSAQEYLGPASCSASNCHGSVTPLNEFKVHQNEYRIWAGLGPKPDKHSRAFAVLREPLAQRIANLLRIGPAHEAAQCLACHEPQIAKEQRGPQYASGDGVSCEECHGPSGKWRDSHGKGGVAHSESVKLGMIDTKDVAVRAAQCLKCHLGAGDRRVDHHLIAAGHPDLTFELDTFTAAMPQHWKIDGNPLQRVRNWAIGQAVQLKDQMKYLNTISQEGRWPDYARLDCAACHHPINRPDDSWRLHMEKGSRQAGTPGFNLAQFAVYRHVADAIQPGSGNQLEADVHNVAVAVTQLSPSKSAVGSSANRAEGLASDLAAKANSITFDQTLTRKMMFNIASDGKTIAYMGPRAALQATWAIDMLFRVPPTIYHAGRAEHDRMKSLLDDMFRHVDGVSEYSAPKFAEQLSKFAEWADLGPTIKTRDWKTGLGKAKSRLPKKRRRR